MGREHLELKRSSQACRRSMQTSVFIASMHSVVLVTWADTQVLGLKAAQMAAESMVMRPFVCISPVKR